MTSYLLKGWNRDKQDICIVVDAEDDLTRGINGHEVARAAAKILDPEIPSVSPAAKTFRRTSLFPTSSSIEC